MTQARTAARIDQRELRNALGSFGTGVTVITTLGRDGNLTGLTASSFNSLSLDPPLVLWSLAQDSPSMPVFQESTHFAVNVLSLEQVHLSRRFGTRGIDKFSGVDWTPGLGGAPLLDGCAAYFECSMIRHYAGGDHLIFIGQVERFTYHSKGPLLFCLGKYFSGYPIQPLAHAAGEEPAMESSWAGIG